MKYLPYENVIYQSKHSPEEILLKIQKVTEPKKLIRMNSFFSSDNNNKHYEGQIEGDTFKINRIIKYSNSFLPRISGFVESNQQGSRIHLKMRLHLFVKIFMCIWFLGVGIGCITFGLQMLKTGSFDPVFVVPFGMLLFGYGLVTGGFKYESIKSKKHLATLFDAEMVESNIEGQSGPIIKY